jgi:Helix-turn-helix domain
MSLLSTSSAPIPVGADDRLRPKEAAQIARVSVGMIYRWLHEERFKSWTVVRRGFERGVRYIDRATFEDFLKSQREEIPA